MYILKISSKWFKIRCSFVSKCQNPKMALCGVLIGKLILFDSINFSWFHIILTIKQSQNRCIIVSSCNLQKEYHGKIAFPNLKSILFTLFTFIFQKSIFQQFWQSTNNLEPVYFRSIFKMKFFFIFSQGFIFPLSLNKWPIKFKLLLQK